MDCHYLSQFFLKHQQALNEQDCLSVQSMNNQVLFELGVMAWTENQRSCVLQGIFSHPSTYTWLVRRDACLCFLPPAKTFSSLWTAVLLWNSNFQRKGTPQDADWAPKFRLGQEVLIKHICSDKVSCTIPFVEAHLLDGLLDAWVLNNWSWLFHLPSFYKVLKLPAGYISPFSLLLRDPQTTTSKAEASD